MVTLSPSDSAMPCVFERMRMKPPILPFASFSIEMFANASSPTREDVVHYAQHHAHRSHRISIARTDWPQ
jgi:hypothetical protein